jgi:outer membrane protein OmpA-like peptidoglycan-associated protein
MNRTAQFLKQGRGGAMVALASVLALAPAAVRADDLALEFAPGVTIPLTAPQTDHFSVGGSESIKLLIGLTPFLDVGPTASFTYLPGKNNENSGTAWGLGGGLRLKRPHDAEDMYGISPWAAVDALYIRTGDLNRPGFAAAVGASVPVGESRAFWIGPFARYNQILQGTRDGFDNRDAKLLTLGIAVEFGNGLERKPAEVAAVGAANPAQPCLPDPNACPDRDHDGVCDAVDHCPEVPGPVEDFGCPHYKKIVVRKDKLELKEKLYFAWDQATLEAASYPVLDEVVQALKDNKNFKVQAEGHTDSSGGDDHNQTLSEKRAAAVVDYLVAHGIDKDRLVSKGFSSSQPLDTNQTAAGRENNRRVEFVVHFQILNDRSSK